MCSFKLTYYAADKVQELYLPLNLLEFLFRRSKLVFFRVRLIYNLATSFPSRLLYEPFKIHIDQLHKSKSTYKEMML